MNGPAPSGSMAGAGSVSLFGGCGPEMKPLVSNDRLRRPTAYSASRGSIASSSKPVMTGLLEDAIDPRLAEYAVGRLRRSFETNGFISGPQPPKSETLPAPAIEPEGAGPFMEWALNYHTNLVVASALRIVRSRNFCLLYT